MNWGTENSWCHGGEGALSVKREKERKREV